jgi:hypothetical protein
MSGINGYERANVNAMSTILDDFGQNDPVENHDSRIIKI